MKCFTIIIALFFSAYCIGQNLYGIGYTPTDQHNQTVSSVNNQELVGSWCLSGYFFVNRSNTRVQAGLEGCMTLSANGTGWSSIAGLVDGIGRVVGDKKPVHFSWRVSGNNLILDFGNNNIETRQILSKNSDAFTTTDVNYQLINYTKGNCSVSSAPCSNCGGKGYITKIWWDQALLMFREANLPCPNCVKTGLLHFHSCN